jgi:acyl-CoA hydrolase
MAGRDHICTNQQVSAGSTVNIELAVIEAQFTSIEVRVRRLSASDKELVKALCNDLLDQLN